MGMVTRTFVSAKSWLCVGPATMVWPLTGCVANTAMRSGAVATKRTRYRFNTLHNRH